MRKLRVTENKRTKYTKKLMKKKIPIRNAWRQRTNATVCSRQWERTGLGGICNVEVGYQVSSISEFRHRNPFRFVSSVFISQPDYLIQEFACPLAINFRIHYLRNFIFRFPINYNWSRGQLYSLRESVEYSRFEHRYIED